jgi:hypothetical protein
MHSTDSDRAEREHFAHLASLPLSEREAAERLPAVRERVERVYAGLRTRVGTQALDNQWNRLLLSLAGEPVITRLRMLEDFEASLIRQRDKLDAEKAAGEAGLAKAAAERHAHSQDAIEPDKVYVAHKDVRCFIDGQTFILKAGWKSGPGDRLMLTKLLAAGAPLQALDPADVHQCPHCRAYYEKPREPAIPELLDRRRRGNSK